MSLGRLDINTSIIALDSFRAKLRKEYFERVKRIVSYLIKFKHTTIRFRSDKPNLYSSPIGIYEWEESVYRKVRELLTKDTPKLKIKYIVTVRYYNSDLYYDLVTSRSITRVSHFLNKTPIV